MQICKIITIPARNDVEETKLYVQINTKNKENLKNKPNVFILSGGPGYNHTDYLGFRYLEEIANVIMFDPRGCGLSAKGNPGTYLLQHSIQDLDIIRQRLGIEKMILAGFSAGGHLALGYTLHYSQYVEQLILISTSPSCKYLETAYENVVNWGTKKQIAMFEKCLKGNFQNQEEWDKTIAILNPLYTSVKKQRIPKHVIIAMKNLMPQDAPLPFSYEVYNQSMLGYLKTFDYT